MSSVDTSVLVQQILEGTSPRDVIGSAVAESSESIADEAAMVTKKVVRNGKIVKKKFKKFKKRRILSAAQKRALKKAQLASKKSSAKIKRVKSLRKAATFEGVDDEEDITLGLICPDCGSHGMNIIDDDSEDASILVCPACGKQFALVDAEALNDLIPDDDEDDEDVDIDIEDDEDVDDDSPEQEGAPADEGVSAAVCGGSTPDDTEDGEEPDDSHDAQLYFEPED